MDRVSTKLLSVVSKKEREALRKNLIASKDILDTVNKAIEKILQENPLEVRKDDVALDIAVKLADVNGYRRALKDIQNLLTIRETDTNE